MEEQSPADKKIHQLIDALSDSSIEKRHQAVRELGNIGRPAVDPLIRALSGAFDNDHRWYAALALSGVGAPAVDLLISAMRVHPENEFRRYAAAWPSKSMSSTEKRCSKKEMAS